MESSNVTAMSNSAPIANTVIIKSDRKRRSNHIHGSNHKRNQRAKRKAARKEKKAELCVRLPSTIDNHDTVAILQYEMPQIAKQFISGALHHADNESRPLHVLRVGLLDIKGLVHTLGVDGIQKYALQVMEVGIEQCNRTTRQSGKPVSSWALLIDFDGLSMRHLWRLGVQALKQLIEICEANYPECLGRMIITRAPRGLPVLWTLIAPFIDENTRNKIHIHAGEPPLSVALMQTYMPLDNVPQFLDGTATCTLPDGGHIPKALYSAPLDDDDQHAAGFTNLFTTAHAYKGLPHTAGSDEDLDDPHSNSGSSPNLTDDSCVPMDSSPSSSPVSVATSTAKTTTLNVNGDVLNELPTNNNSPALTPRVRTKRVLYRAKNKRPIMPFISPVDDIIKADDAFDMPSSSPPRPQFPSTRTPKTVTVARITKGPSTKRKSASSRLHDNETLALALKKTPPTQLPDLNVQQYKGVQNFKNNRNSLVQQLLNTFNECIFENLIPSNTEILWKSRFTKTAGKCVYRRENGKRVVRIELSSKVIDRPCRVRDTLCHELCHAAVWIQSGDAKSGHGEKFKTWARRASKIYPQLPVITRSHSYDICSKYVYRCVGCSAEVHRHSKSLNTARKVCGKCQGIFALYRQTANGGEVAVECPRPMPLNCQAPILFNFDRSTSDVPKPTRSLNAFAKFVKENYATYRAMGRTHKEAMSKLSLKYKEKKSN